MPINYELPTVCRIDDKEYPIRNKGDYRVILDTISALDDKDLTENDRIFAALYIFLRGRQYSGEYRDGGKRNV